MLKHIALFGGSFDPPHLGHLAVIQDLISKPEFDELWLVPVFQHPFQKQLTSFEHRLAMLELLLLHLKSNKVRICEIEKELGQKQSYFFDTVSALKIKSPNSRFHILVGSDVKNSLDKWHKIESLKQIADFHFLPRDGYEKSPYPQISSTQVRECIAKKTSLQNLVLPEIQDYIAKHKLYS